MEPKHRRTIALVKYLLYGWAIYCLIFCLCSSPKFIKSLHDYNIYLNSETEPFTESKYHQGALPTLREGRKETYIVWYGLSKLNRFHERDLKGKPAETAIQTFGAPDAVVHFDEYTSIRYWPYPHIHVGEFRVECFDGIIHGAEIFD